ncbi:MAG TPA: ATP-dependent zinc metalloprotease FtsH [Acidimicrobiales bacterium]|nr:ATP-dependent zinc metalloprotease FtsH [Acidimicrobiales bacterium]
MVSLGWLAGIVAVVILSLSNTSPKPTDLTYSAFLRDVAAKQVKSVTIQQSGSATGQLTRGGEFTTVIPPQAGQDLLANLQQAGVDVEAVASGGTGWGASALGWGLVVLPMALLGYWLYRSAKGGSGALGGAAAVGRSRARVFDAERPTTTFSDIAGYEGAKAEIAEAIDFLRNPDRYKRAGAAAPKGILMVGPPGTGKTLLARAVAGEAAVPFFSVAGSSFVEMFVGVGAARVRDLFREARQRAPCIVFVDEIDGLGQRRSSSGLGVGNDEREQTLNQLLSEMDGFDPAEGVVVLAATNRPDILDPALLRPGRFDRQVVIPLPTQSERKAILAVHCRDKHLGTDVDLDYVARGTPGFSGADLANLANEAAIVAVRDDRTVISASDFDEARDRILLGRRDGSNVLLPEEKYAVAVHEAGHAIVAGLCPDADPVAKVTILPSGNALGVTQQLPLAERHLYGEGYLRDTLAVRLGGRAAELIEIGEASTGAADDLARATDLAVRMVREFGLSEKLGPASYPQQGSVFLDESPGRGWTSRPYGEETQAAIDREVTGALRAAQQRATDLLTAHRWALEQLVQLLLVEETVAGSAVEGLLRQGAPSESGGPPVISAG